jgi:hypothetical protein
MITHLTSELNRINQGCGKSIQIYPETPNVFYICGDNRLHSDNDSLTLCPTCQKEKETLKKVSLMWADFILNYEVNKIDDLIDELKQIKSLIENQEDFQKLGSHEPSQMEKA